LHLELSAALGELEGNGAAGEAAVDLAVGIEAVVDTTTLLLVEDDLEGLGAVLLGAGALADDLDGVDEISEDGIVDGGQSARAGALLGLVGARVDGALGAGQDAALSNEEDVAVGELLLELAGQTVIVRFGFRDFVYNVFCKVRGLVLTAAGSCGSWPGGGRGRRQ
jgi:hypothetical protein